MNPNPLQQMFAQMGVQQPAMPSSMMPQMPMGQSGIQFQNPVQKMNYIMQAMRNPAAFVKNMFPDIPNQIMNDGDQVLNYLKQTRGITDQDIQKAQNQYGGWWPGR